VRGQPATGRARPRHIRIVDSLEASIANHPASGRREAPRPERAEAGEPPAADDAGAVVLRFRPRRADRTPRTPDAA
jgi:hypothetical protein